MTGSTFHFLSVYWLALLPLFWLYCLWWFARHARGHHSSMADADMSVQYYHPLAIKYLAQCQEQTSSVPVFYKQHDFWWQGLVVSLMIISLAQPVWIGERLPDPPPERDIIFVVDTSVSMQLKDYQLEGEAVSRMALLHHLLDEFASKMAGERIAVIVFGEAPYVLVPLSHDQNLIRSMLYRVTTSLAGRYSAVGDALLMARFLAEDDANQQPSRHQTVILFTDAHESLGKATPAAAADLLAEKNIPIFTVAIGSSQQTEEVKGGLYQPVNIALLEDIAKRTQGANYRVSNGESMEQALQAILQQRQNKAIPQPHYVQHRLFHYPLGLAVLLLLLSLLLRLITVYREGTE